MTPKKGPPLPWYTMADLAVFMTWILTWKLSKMVYNVDSSICFLMVGDLPQSTSSNAPPNLEILPAMKLEKLAKVLASCHLGICLLRELPAMRSAFPAKAYDYIGAGIPVLAGPKGELTQLVDQFKIGTTFEKISAKEVADIILGLKKMMRSGLRCVPM